MFSLSADGVAFLLLWLSFCPVFRFVRLVFFGRELVIDELVADMKLLLAALRNEVGKTRRILWAVGSVCDGGMTWDDPKTFICEGGIHGASR